MKRCYVYILECSDGSYYTGSTIDLVRRFDEHMRGVGSNYTRGRLPVELKYYEVFNRIDEAFEREKQISRWSHGKKFALIHDRKDELQKLSFPPSKRTE